MIEGVRYHLPTIIVIVVIVVVVVMIFSMILIDGAVAVSVTDISVLIGVNAGEGNVGFIVVIVGIVSGTAIAALTFNNDLVLVVMIFHVDHAAVVQYFVVISIVNVDAPNFFLVIYIHDDGVVEIDIESMLLIMMMKLFLLAVATNNNISCRDNVRSSSSSMGLDDPPIIIVLMILIVDHCLSMLSDVAVSGFADHCQQIIIHVSCRNAVEWFACRRNNSFLLVAFAMVISQ